MSDSAHQYALGQVIYVVLKKELCVYPMQITEIVDKRTLDGAVTTYMVRGGTDPKAQLLITDVDGEVFDSSERAKQILLERATVSITKLVDAAAEKAREWYPNMFESPADDPMALIKKSPEQAAKRRRARPKSEVAELAAEFQREAEELAERGVQLVTLPDGSKAKVRSLKLPDALQR